MKIIKNKKDQEVLKELKGEVIIARAESGYDVDYPIIIDGVVYDVEKIQLYTWQYCQVLYSSGGHPLGEGIGGGGFYYIASIKDGEYGAKNKKHNAKRLELFNRWFKKIKGKRR